MANVYFFWSFLWKSVNIFISDYFEFSFLSNLQSRMKAIEIGSSKIYKMQIVTDVRISNVMIFVWLESCFMPWLCSFLKLFPLSFSIRHLFILIYFSFRRCYFKSIIYFTKKLFTSAQLCYFRLIFNILLLRFIWNIYSHLYKI